MNRSTAIIRLCVCTAIGLLSTNANAEVDFDKQVRPIFAENCYKCHGPEKQKGQLRLDSPAAIRKGGDSGEPIFLVGKSADSHLIKLVARTDPDEAMPPEGKGDPLSKAEVDLLREWIDQGAPMPGGDVADVKLTTDHWSFQPLRKVADKNDIDAFVQESMSSRGLSASGRADRLTLIRRLYLVMHGMPPGSEEIATFLADESPNAWAKLVDRVLASPRYGERWARHWLDIVRFAESNGFETNRERLNAYHFRDYVIDAFNQDKPYDQFIKEQIAGDAMGVEIGTGFLVAGPYDIVKSPDINLTLMQRQDELADMVNTTGTTFLGLTLGCARCHNHKFDPITQKDFYSFQAVFAGVTYGDRAIKRTLTDQDKQRVQDLRLRVAENEVKLAQLKKIAAANAGEPDTNLRPPVNAKLNTESFPATEVKFVRFTISKTNSSQPCIDELMVLDPAGENVALGAVPTSSGDLTGYPIHKLEHINDGKVGNSRSWISNQPGKGWVQLELKKPQNINRIEWARDRDGKFSDRVATDYVIEGSADGSQWRELASSADRQPFGGKADPTAFLAKLKPEQATLARQLMADTAAKITQISGLQNGNTAWIANFRQPGKTHRLYRGDPMAKREEVAPDALEVTGSLGLKKNAPEQQRRVAVANWIAHEDNPLTARVMVNRLWQFTFGIGIVDTPSDFGANGTLPTHPELLDWLAAEFVESGWSTKHLLRLMLNSDTFQQSSKPRAEAAKIDADSRYLWRFPPRRLEAEAIRDSILTVSGALDLSMGGRGFYLLDVDRENVVHYYPKEKTGPAEWRRMIYMFKIRQEQDAVFGSFDCPDGNQVIPKRSRSTTPLQALNLFNSQFIMQQADKLAADLKDDPRRVAIVFQRCYGRAPDQEELADAEKFIAEEGLQAFCRAMFNTNEFLFVF